MELNIFLTAYDPSDLPGGSIDPLGFEAGYLFLAEKLLPDLTNVANRPRYFSVLCAGIQIADGIPAASPRDQYEKRRECVLRLERLWILANVLASKECAEDELPTAGIRGITYAEARAAELKKRGLSSANHEYQLLSKQPSYGLLGIYGAVAERVRMIDRGSLALTQDLGEPLATAFRKETKMPPEVVESVQKGGKVALDTLVAWGRRSHISAKTGRNESACLEDALFNRNRLRSFMLGLLEQHNSINEQETELNRMKRIVTVAWASADCVSLAESMRFVFEYESCYRLVSLGLERLLWLCRALPAGAIVDADLANDRVIGFVCSKLPGAVARYLAALEGCNTPEFRQDLSRLDNVKSFLVAAVGACGDPVSLADTVLDRHRDVQVGKFDRGRRKMPWIQRQDGYIRLTLSRSGGQGKEITSPEEIEPHYYRFFAADQMIKAARGL